MTNLIAAEIEHSRVGASSYYRYSQCPASVRLIASLPHQSGEAADLGTAAHMVLEMCLEQNRDAEEFIDRQITVERSGRKFIVDERMAEAVQHCVDVVRAIQEMHLDEVKLMVEQTITLPWPELEMKAFGTTDVVLWAEESKTLHILDYKNGRGYVDVQENTQLIFYAYGVIETLKIMPETLYLHIVQPHADGESWRYQAYDVAKLLARKPEMIAAINRVADPDAPAITGKHCEFCSAAPICPAKKSEINGFLSEALGLPVAVGEQPIVTLPSPKELTPEQLGLLCSSADILEQWISEVWKTAEAHALNGVHIPDHKVIRGSKHRRWKDEEAAAKEIVALVGEEKAYTKKLLSPAAAEKIAAVKKRLAAIAAESEDSDLIEKPEGALKLVHISKRGEAVDPKAASLAQAAHSLGLQHSDV